MCFGSLPEVYGSYSRWAGAALYDLGFENDLDVLFLPGLRKRARPVAELKSLCIAPPANFAPTTIILYRNGGDGTFEDVSKTSGVSAKEGRGLGVAFADYDGDGFTDVFIANDAMEQFLWPRRSSGSYSAQGRGAEEEAGSKIKTVRRCSASSCSKRVAIANCSSDSLLCPMRAKVSPR